LIRGVRAARAPLTFTDRPHPKENRHGAHPAAQYTLFSGYEGARQPDVLTGKCHFAGEHCSQSFQGFMEGGAEEGARAANEILSDYKAGIFP
jgi:Flavin containing amine oxidoreductase